MPIAPNSPQPKSNITTTGKEEKAPVVDSPKEALLRKLAKVRVIHEKLIQSRGEVKGKDPSKEYIWVNVDENRQTYFQGMGWVVCKDPNVKTMWKKEDGTHRRGDLILYEVSKEDKEVFDLDSQLRAIEAISGSKNEFLDFAATNRVPAQLQEV